MRKIEKEMLQAVAERRTTWISGNTAVLFYETACAAHQASTIYPHARPSNSYGPRSEIYLHGNHIGTIWHGGGVFSIPTSTRLDVDRYTLKRWPTATTKSRLRAFGANITTRAGITYLDGKPI